MEEKRNTVSEEKRQAEARDDDIAHGGRDSGIGTGKKVGLYGCGFLVLGVIIVLIVLIVTGTYVPFEGTEGVGP